MYQRGSRLSREALLPINLLYLPSKHELLEGSDWLFALSEAPSISSELRCLQRNERGTQNKRPSIYIVLKSLDAMCNDKSIQARDI